MVRHYIDEVLNFSLLHQLSIIRSKLEAISYRSQSKLTCIDDHITSLYTGIQLFIAVIGCIILINGSCCINRPVDIQASQKTVCHILIRLAIVLSCSFLWKLICYSQEFTLYPLGNICARLAGSNIHPILLAIDLIYDRSITKVVHFQISEVSTDGTSCSHILRISIRIDNLIGFHNTLTQYIHPVNGRALICKIMQRRIGVCIRIQPVSTIRQSRKLIT